MDHVEKGLIGEFAHNSCLAANEVSFPLFGLQELVYTDDGTFFIDKIVLPTLSEADKLPSHNNDN